MNSNPIHSELINLACQSFKKCDGPASQVPICAIDYSTGLFMKFPDKCAVFKYNCEKRGREYETYETIFFVVYKILFLLLKM